MSFFDDDPDEPIRASRGPGPRPRSSGAPTRRASGPARPRPRPGGPGGGPTTPADVQTRRLVAAGAGLVLLLVLFFGLRSCADSRTERALKDYNREVGTIAASSVDEVAGPFFELMSSGADEARDLQVQVNELRLRADEDVKQATNLDVPDQMARAHTFFTLVLNLRADGIRRIGDRLDEALVTGRDNAQTAEDALSGIAAQMEAFLASDVVYDRRVRALIDEALKAEEIGGQRIQPSRFLPSIAWLSVDQLADRLGSVRAGGGRGGNPNPAPGLHGHGLTSVTVGSTALQPSPAVNRIAAGANPSFTVKFANQGENDESDVAVTVRIRGGGGRAITARKTVNQTKAGTESTVSIPLGQAPPVGQAVTIEVSVEGVPGEKKTDNNKQSYTAIFTR